MTLALDGQAMPGGTEARPVIVANADGVLDLASADQAESPEAMPNPFRIRWHPPRPIREVRMVIAGVLVGPGPDETAVCINGRLYGRGDRFEGLTISAIGADEIELSQQRFRLRVPVQDQPVTLRLTGEMRR